MQTKRFVGLLASIAALGFLAAGCTSVDYAFTEATTSQGGQHRYGDSDPVHEWEGGVPHQLPVHGVDVAKYQGDLNWSAIKSAGIEFAFIKATEGGDLLDDKFARNWAEAKRVGIPRSAYHFYYFCTPARVQAEWFIRNVPRERGTLPHVLDMEWNSHSPTCRKRPDPAVVRAEMKVFMDRLESHYGKRPIIYTTVDFHRDNLVGHLPQEVFWLRSVAAHPRITYPGRPWAFWQYTGTGRITGVDGDIDINAFAGTRQQWRDWLQRALR